jgi:hypothetical protein
MSTPVESNTSIPLKILTTLREKVENLPRSVPAAKRTGPLGGYSCNPVELTKEIVLDVDIWETWDPILNALISHRVSENHTLVTRGKYGLIGLVCFMEHLVRDRKLDEGLLEGKVGRIIEAIDRYYFFVVRCSFLLTKLIVLVSASHEAHNSQMFPTKSSLSEHRPRPKPSPSTSEHPPHPKSSPSKSEHPPHPKPSPSKSEQHSHCHLKGPKASLRLSPPLKRCPHPKRFLMSQSERPSHPNHRPSQSDSGGNCQSMCPRWHVLHPTRRRLVSPSRRNLLEKLRREGGDLGLLRTSPPLSKSLKSLLRLNSIDYRPCLGGRQAQAARDWKQANPKGTKQEFIKFWDVVQRDNGKLQVRL